MSLLPRDKSVFPKIIIKKTKFNVLSKIMNVHRDGMSGELFILSIIDGI
jgi:hypothetical protein